MYKKTKKFSSDANIKSFCQREQLFYKKHYISGLKSSFMRMVFRLKFLWRAPHVLVEETRKMLRILEAQLIGRLLDAGVGQQQLVLGQVHDIGNDVVLRPHAYGLLDQVTEIP